MFVCAKSNIKVNLLWKKQNLFTRWLRCVCVCAVSVTRPYIPNSLSRGQQNIEAKKKRRRQRRNKREVDSEWENSADEMPEITARRRNKKTNSSGQYYRCVVVCWCKAPRYTVCLTVSTGIWYESSPHTSHHPLVWLSDVCCWCFCCLLARSKAMQHRDRSSIDIHVNKQHQENFNRKMEHTEKPKKKTTAKWNNERQQRQQWKQQNNEIRSFGRLHGSLPQHQGFNMRSLRSLLLTLDLRYHLALQSNSSAPHFVFWLLDTFLCFVPLPLLSVSFCAVFFLL